MVVGPFHNLRYHTSTASWRTFWLSILIDPCTPCKDRFSLAHIRWCVGVYLSLPCVAAEHTKPITVHIAISWMVIAILMVWCTWHVRFPFCCASCDIFFVFSVLVFALLRCHCMKIKNAGVHDNHNDKPLLKQISWCRQRAGGHVDCVDCLTCTLQGQEHPSPT